MALKMEADTGIPVASVTTKTVADPAVATAAQYPAGSSASKSAYLNPTATPPAVGSAPTNANGTYASKSALMEQRLDPTVAAGAVAPGVTSAYPAGMAVATQGVTTVETTNHDPDGVQTTKAQAGDFDGRRELVEQQMATDADIMKDSQTSPTQAQTTPTGGGTSTRKTGSGTSSGGTSTGGTTGGTGTDSGAGATGGWQTYFDKAVNTEFNYNPAEDNEYRLAASQVEQKVTDMMVGRGGLYSSVAQSALTSRLMELQVAYQKQAYEKFKEERDFNLKLASFVADREDTEWEKSFKMAQFKADQDQRKFDNGIKSAQLRISQANAAYNRQIAAAKAKQAEAQNQYLMMKGDYEQNIKQYESLVAKWQQDGTADYEIASYFHVPLGTDVATRPDRIDDALRALETQGQSVINYAQSTNDGKLYLDALEDLYKESSDPATISKAYEQNYASAYNSAINAVQSGASWTEVYNDAYGSSTQLLDELGQDNYARFMRELAAKAEKE